MNTQKRRYNDDVPDDITAQVRGLCLALPDAYEERAWVGTRWKVRSKTFAHVLGVEVPGTEPVVALAFRAEGEDLDMLRHAGPPFFVLGWGRNALGLTLNTDTDWDEVRELITDSFSAMAPKKLVTLLNRPDTPDHSTPSP